MEHNSLHITQAKLLSCMFNDSKYVDFITFDSSLLTDGFKQMLDYFRECRQERRKPDIVDFSRSYPQYTDLMISVAEMFNAEINDVDAFVAYEKTAIKVIKEENLHKLMEKYHSGKIDMEKFNEKHKELMEITIEDNGKATPEKGMSHLREKDKIVEISKYKTLSELMRIEKKGFVVVAAGTGGGKSAFAMNLLDCLAKETPCVYFNMEMGESTWYSRLASIHNNIRVRDIQDNIEDYPDCLEFLREEDVEVYHRSMYLDDIRSILARHDHDKHFIVFIDNISNIQVKGPNQYEKMTFISKQLRAMALDNNCTIFGLCQFSRPNEKPKTYTTSEGKKVVEQPKPNINRLRDSGEIEQSATHVILLYEEYDKEYEKLIYKIELGKTRGSAPGEVISAYFFKDTQIIKEGE